MDKKLLVEQTVYLSIEIEPNSNEPIEYGEFDDDCFTPHKEIKPQVGYFFTHEQLNELLSDVIKDTLNTAAIRAEIEDCGNPYDPNDDSKTVSEKSITDTFEEIFQKHKL